VAVLRADDLDSAVAISNAVPYGIVTNDLRGVN
jgi:acyl-CoA reductase-like NAD-dependent aldehyde dehydrogenase